jgi:hypothetical protein
MGHKATFRKWRMRRACRHGLFYDTSMKTWILRRKTEPQVLI